MPTDKTMTVSPLRQRVLNGAPVRPDGAFVLYWMVAARRAQDNFALDRAVELAAELRRPLLILEALRCDYPHASDRLHTFVLEGMRDTARAVSDTPVGVTYRSYVEPHAGAGRGLVETLAAQACAVVTDDFPAFFLPRMVAAVGARLPVHAVAVDGFGLVPMRAVPKAMPSAAAFRHHVHAWVPSHPEDLPAAAPFERLRGLALPTLPRPPEAFAPRWDFGVPEGVAHLPISHDVAPVARVGGSRAALARLAEFRRDGLPRYLEDRNHPDRDCTSGLSPYLHFGHISAHRVFSAVTQPSGWHPGLAQRAAKGRREGFWGLGPAEEAFVDQLVVWREVGANLCHYRPDTYATLDGLPPWAQDTLRAHAGDTRAFLYEQRAFEAAATHDPLWNAAQRQLVREGRLHNYLRMLWGKKILEWSASPADAMRVLVTLNDRYALDGRDPNSYCGIGWVLGRHDRPWPPERPVLGTLRPMSSDRTAAKVDVARFLRTFSP